MGRRGRRRELEVRSEEVESQHEPGADLTVVGGGARLEGTVVSIGGLRIEGQVKGRITAAGTVTLSPHSEVEGDVEAEDVVVGGTITGDITAKGRIELTRGARVEGTIRCAALTVGEGAMFSGQSIMEGTTPLESSGGDPGSGATPGRGKAKEASSEVAGDREDGLRRAHRDAARQAAEWFGSRLPGPVGGAEPGTEPVREAAPAGSPVGAKGDAEGSPPRPRAKAR